MRGKLYLTKQKMKWFHHVRNDKNRITSYHVNALKCPKMCCLMKTIQESLSSTQLLKFLSSTLKKTKKRFPINTEDQQLQCILQSYICCFYIAMLMLAFIQTLESLKNTCFLTLCWWYQLVIHNCDHKRYPSGFDFYNSIIKFLETSEMHISYTQ